MRIRKPVERWFDVDNDPDNAKIKIKHLSPGELSDISNKVFKQKINYKKVGKDKFEPEITHDADSMKFKELTLMASVDGWENFFDDEGIKLECTPENILRASRGIEGFDESIDEFREILAKDIKTEQGEQEKNLSSSASEPVK